LIIHWFIYSSGEETGEVLQQKNMVLEGFTRGQGKITLTLLHRHLTIPTKGKVPQTMMFQETPVVFPRHSRSYLTILKAMILKESMSPPTV